MLYHFRHLRNSSVLAHFIDFCSTTTSSVTSVCGTAPERIGQNEEPASRDEEPTRDKPNSAPEKCLNDAPSDQMCIKACSRELCLIFQIF